MSERLSPLLLYLLFLLVNAAELSAQAELPEPVQAKLLANVDVVKPGELFHLGVLLETKAGWHTYWKYPGDAGLPTEIAFSAPEELRVGTLRWPTPGQFVQPADIVGYGYEEDVLLLAEVIPDTGLTLKEISITAEVKWLACGATLCIPGKATLPITLPVGRKAKPSDEQKLFNKWQARLPTSAGSPGSPAVATASGALARTGQSSITIDLEWDIPPDDLLWIPALRKGLTIKKLTLRNNGQHTKIQCEAEVLQGFTLQEGVLETVVRYKDKDSAVRGISIPIAIK